MNKSIILCLVFLWSTSLLAAIRCEIYEGPEPIENEKSYDECVFDYKTSVLGIPTYVRSCTLVEPKSGIYYEFEYGQIFQSKAIMITSGNSEGAFPGTRLIYFEDSKTKRESVSIYGSNRVECHKI